MNLSAIDKLPNVDHPRMRSNKWKVGHYKNEVAKWYSAFPTRPKSMRTYKVQCGVHLSGFELESPHVNMIAEMHQEIAIASMLDCLAQPFWRVDKARARRISATLRRRKATK